MDDLLGPIIYWSSWYYISSRLYCLYSTLLHYANKTKNKVLGINW